MLPMFFLVVLPQDSASPSKSKPNDDDVRTLRDTLLPASSE